MDYYNHRFQDDTIVEGAPFGVYEYIDENGNPVFIKVTD